MTAGQSVWSTRSSSLPSPRSDKEGSPARSARPPAAARTPARQRRGEGLVAGSRCSTSIPMSPRTRLPKQRVGNSRRPCTSGPYTVNRGGDLRNPALKDTECVPDSQHQAGHIRRTRPRASGVQGRPARSNPTEWLGTSYPGIVALGRVRAVSGVGNQDIPTRVALRFVVGAHH